jgi:hypothetical protein
MNEPENDAMWSGNGPSPDTAIHGERFEDLLPERLRELVDPGRMRELIRAHPLSVTFGALALGFIVARAMRED